VSGAADSRGWRYPAAVWLVALGSVFATEAITHMVMPRILPEEPSRLLDAALDAIVLTVVLAPVLWHVLVRPLREAGSLRANFLADLFVSIEADRRRTAHDLHDGVGQSLTMLVSGLKSAEPALTDPDAARRCRELRDLAQTALHDVKRLALGLRPSLLDDLGLAPALERVLADVRDNHPITIELDAGALAGQRLPEAVETAVFRIVQEALTNVVRHARATRATVEVRRHGSHVVVTITDDGVGIPAAVRRGRNPGHLGLIGMRERATLLGGDLAVTSAPNKGTRIRATIPVEGRVS
jgi:signal transduction histidine kinase